MSNSEYTLYSAKSCPYAHRVEIIRLILGLDQIVEIKYCNPVFTFGTKWMINKQELINICNEFDKDFKKLTLPLLFDNLNKKIINESSDIIKIMNKLTTSSIDLYPIELHDSIDQFCDDFNKEIGTGTYMAGHAKTQEIYEKYFISTFAYLDKLDNRLNGKTYIFNNILTIADIYAYVHLVRFDPIFHDLFVLNKKYLREYDNINAYLNNLNSINAFTQSLDLEEMKKGAFESENNLPQNLGCEKMPFDNSNSNN